MAKIVIEIDLTLEEFKSKDIFDLVGIISDLNDLPIRVKSIKISEKD